MVLLMVRERKKERERDKERESTSDESAVLIQSHFLPLQLRPRNTGPLQHIVQRFSSRCWGQRFSSRPGGEHGAAVSRRSRHPQDGSVITWGVRDTGPRHPPLPPPCRLKHEGVMSCFEHLSVRAARRPTETSRTRWRRWRSAPGAPSVPEGHTGSKRRHRSLPVCGLGPEGSRSSAARRCNRLETEAEDPVVHASLIQL